MEGRVACSESRARQRVGPLAVGLAAIMLVAAACGGGKAAGPARPAGQISAQQLDSFAACMRGHGLANFYFTAQSSNSGGQLESVIDFAGEVAPADPASPQFQSAMKACRHLLPLPAQPTAAQLRKMLAQQVRFAACMRAHGFPDYPDPTTQDGVVVRPDLPANIDPNSPQFQAAQVRCNSH